LRPAAKSPPPERLLALSSRRHEDPAKEKPYRNASGGVARPKIILIYFSTALEWEIAP
jgi:hypothetical protein